MLLLFISGLLPDPDTSFALNDPDFCTWIVAFAFEVVLLALNTAATVQQPNRRYVFPGYAFNITLQCTRTMLLFAMMSLYSSTCHRWSCLDGISEEAKPLQQGNETTEYGTIDESQQNQPKIQSQDAQTAGWVEYFYSFRALFLYI